MFLVFQNSAQLLQTETFHTYMMFESTSQRMVRYTPSVSLHIPNSAVHSQSDCRAYQRSHAEWKKKRKRGIPCKQH